MLRQLLIVVIPVLVLACSEIEVVVPIFNLRAEFDPSNVDRVDSFIKATATQWNLSVLEKGRDQMAFLTQGQEAFFLALYSGETPILDITNAGAGTILVLHVYDYGEMPLEQLNELADEIVISLNQNFGIELMSQLE